MQLHFLTAVDWSELTAFLQRNSAEIVQYPAWGELSATLGGRAQRLAVRAADGAILAAAQVLVRPLPGGGRWLLVARGPVFTTELSAAQAEQAWQILQTGLAELAHTTRAVFARYDWPSELPTAVHPAAVGRPAHASHFPATTLLLDLTQTTAAILAQMKPKGRYNLKIAEKHGVTVTETTAAAAADIFYDLLQKTTARDGFAGHGAAYYRQFLQLLAPAGLASAFVAEHAGRPVAAILVTWAGARATYYYGASDHAARAVMAPYAVQWAAVQAAKTRGCTVYDFLGIAPEDSAEVHPLAGVTRFKKQFGGRTQTYPPSREVVYRPAAYALLRLAKKLRGLR